MLDLPGQPESRHYIQGWLSGCEITVRNCRRIFAATDKIMKAGQPVAVDEVQA